MCTHRKVVNVLCQAHKDGSLQQLLCRDGEVYDYDLIVIGGGSGGLACSKVKARIFDVCCVMLVAFIIFVQGLANDQRGGVSCSYVITLLLSICIKMQDCRESWKWNQLICR